MAKVKDFNGPRGWLIDPHNKWAIHFDLKNDSLDHVGEDFTIDMWGVDTNGKPLKFKSRRKVSKEDFLKIWRQLLGSNWTELDFANIKSA